MFKRLLLILLIATGPFCLAQYMLDTSKVTFIRTGWEIKSSDSCLYARQSRYASGLHRQDLWSCSGSLLSTEISVHEIRRPFYGRNFLPLMRVSVIDGQRNAERHYYSDSDIPDSVAIDFPSSGKPGMTIRYKKKYNNQGLIASVESHEGIHEYVYNDSGQLATITLRRRNGQLQIKEFKKNLVIKESLVSRKGDLINEEVYQYDEKDRVIRADINKYEYWIYSYGPDGILKEEKHTGSENKREITESVDYAYDRSGRLISETRREGSRVPRVIRYHY